VIISTLLIQFYGWTGFDPIASLFIAVLIAASVVPLVIDTGKILALDVGDKDAAIQEALHEVSLPPLRCPLCQVLIPISTHYSLRPPTTAFFYRRRRIVLVSALLAQRCRICCGLYSYPVGALGLFVRPQRTPFEYEDDVHQCGSRG
jgi:hypothetical protein